MKRSYRWLGAAGVLFLAGAVAWWLVAVPVLVRYPDDVDETLRYQGELTLHVDPETGAPLARPLQLPATIDRRIAVTETTLAEAVIDETITIRYAGTEVVERHRYVMDRRSMEFEEDDRAYAYQPDFGVDRSGMYRVNLPLGVGAGDTYPIFNNETGKAYRLESTGVEAEAAGRRVLRFAGSLREAPVAGYYAEVLEGRGFPADITFEQLRPLLAAAGIDIDSMARALATVLEPAEMAALQEGLSAPIPLAYLFDFDGEIGVEPKTGAIVEMVSVDESVLVKPDFAALGGLLELLNPYRDDPVVQRVTATLASLAEQPARPVFELRYAQTPESVADTVAEAEDMAGRIRLAEQIVPGAMVALGLVLVALAVFLRRRGHGAQTPAETRTPPREPVGAR